MCEQGAEDNKSKNSQLKKTWLIWYLFLKKRKDFREGEGGLFLLF